MHMRSLAELQKAAAMHTHPGKISLLLLNVKFCRVILLIYLIVNIFAFMFFLYRFYHLKFSFGLALEYVFFAGILTFILFANC